MNEFYSIVDSVRSELRALSDFIHENPEYGFQEFKAVDAISSFLGKHGFKTQKGICGMETAFISEPECRQEPHPAVAILGEYDALRGLGHGCGHNLIAACGAAAFFAASKYAEKHGIKGRLAMIGTPAEEYDGGKVFLVRNGAFKDFDMALISHPYDRTFTDGGHLSVSHISVEFRGAAAHAAINPHSGLNALDAMVLFYDSVSMWRQQLPEPCRVHGIITHGGDSPNIIPDFTSSLWYVRAQDVKTKTAMVDRFIKMIEAAAAATGTTASYKVDTEYQPGLVNYPLNREYARLWKQYGVEIPVCKGTEGRGSSDIGDVQQVIPAASLNFGICAEAGTPLHSIPFREAAFTDFGFEQAVKTASMIAEIAIKYLSDENFRGEVDADKKAKS